MTTTTRKKGYKYKTYTQVADAEKSLGINFQHICICMCFKAKNTPMLRLEFPYYQKNTDWLQV